MAFLDDLKNAFMAGLNKGTGKDTQSSGSVPTGERQTNAYLGSKTSGQSKQSNDYNIPATVSAPKQTGYDGPKATITLNSQQTNLLRRSMAGEDILHQPVQQTPTTTDWSKLAGTSRGALAYIDSVYRTDPTKGNQLYAQYMQGTLDPSSAYYSPFNRPTNRAVDALRELGWNVDNIDDKWFEDNAYLKDYYVYTANTNSLSSTMTKKRNPVEMRAAYYYNQLFMENENTKKALAEVDAAKKEIAYWTGRTDLNLSPEQIIQRLNISGNSAYKTLAKMDESRMAGTPMELNRAIGYNGEDDLYTWIWQAMNNGGSGDIYADKIAAAYGYGNVWKEDLEKAAKLDVGNLETYSPYDVGMTGLDEEGKYFGRVSFDQKWIDENRAKYLGSGNPQDAKMFNNVQAAEEFTQKLEGQRALLNERIDSYLKTVQDPNAVLEMLQDDDDHEFTDLFSLDKTLKTGKLKATTRAVNYRWEDVKADIIARCEKANALKNGSDLVDEANASTTGKDVSIDTESVAGKDARTGAAATPVTPTGVNTAPAGTQSTQDGVNLDVADQVVGKDTRPPAESKSMLEQFQSATAKVGAVARALTGYAVNNLNKMAGAILKKGTDEEKIAFATGKTTSFDQDVENIQSGTRDPGEWMQSASTKNLVTGYFDQAGTVYEYEAHQKNAEALQQKLNEIQDRWKELSDKKAETDAIGNMTRDQFENLMALTAEDPADVDEFWEEAVYALEGGENGRFSREQALGVLYQRVTGSSIEENQGQHDAAYEAHLEQANKWWEYTKTASPDNNFNFLSEEESAELDDLDRQKNYWESQLQEEQTYAKDNEQAYRDAKNERMNLMKDYIIGALFNGGDMDLLKSIDTLYLAGQSSVPPPYYSNNVFDMQVSSGEMTREQANASAAYTAVYNNAYADLLENTLNNLDSYGSNVSDEFRANVQSNIDYLRKDAKSSGYVMLDGVVGFAEQAKAGEEEVKNNSDSYGPIAKLIAGLPAEFDQASAWAALGTGGLMTGAQKANADRASLVHSMTQEEKNRYMFLLKAEGEKAADDYFNMLIDPEFGAVTIRLNEDMKTEMQEFSRANAGNAFLSTLISFGTNAIGGPLALFDEVTAKLSGKSINVNSDAYRFNDLTQAARGGAKELINKTFGGEDKLGAKIFNLIYDGFTSSVDSYINAKATGALFNIAGTMFEGTKIQAIASAVDRWLDVDPGIGKKTTRFFVKASSDFAHAVPMGLNAAASTYRDIIMQYGKGYEEQAMKMAVATFWAETGSEAITVGNLHEAFASGQTEGIEHLLIEFFKNGAEEALGEGANQWIEDHAERYIMGAQSKYEKTAQKYIDQGYPKTVAYAMADKESWNEILTSAATGFISSGFGTAAEFARGRLTSNSTNEGLGFTSEDVNTEPVENNTPESENPAELTQTDVNAEALAENIAEESTIDPDVAPWAEHLNVDNRPVVNHVQVGNKVYDLHEGEELKFNPLTGQEYIVQTGPVEAVDAPSPELQAQDAAAVANLQNQKAAAEAAKNELQKSLAVLTSISNGVNPTGGAEGIASVLNIGNIHAAKASAQYIVGSMANCDVKIAARTLSEIMLANPGQISNDQLVTAITQASLTSGAGHQNLQQIFDFVKHGVKITQDDVSRLVTTIQQDRAANPVAFDEAYKEAIKASRVANRTIEIYQDGKAGEAVDAAKKTVAGAKAGVNNAQQALENAQADLDTAVHNITVAVNEQMSGDATNPATNAPIEQAAEDIEGATTNIQQQEQAVEAAQENVEQAKQEQSDVEDQKMAEARAQAVAEVEQQIAEEEQAEAEAAEAQAQQEFEEGLAAHPTTKGFTAPVSVQTRGGETVKLTGLYAKLPGNRWVYSTTNGYIQDDAINWGNSSKADLQEMDAAKDKWKDKNNPNLKVAKWLPQSVSITTETGETADIVGIVASVKKQDITDPVVVDTSGNLYDASTFDYDAGNPVYDLYGDGENLPEISVLDLYQAQHPSAQQDTGETQDTETQQAAEPPQLPDGFVPYPNGPVTLKYDDGTTVDALGVIPDRQGLAAGDSVVLADGSTITAGSLIYDNQQAQDFMAWVVEEHDNAAVESDDLLLDEDTTQTPVSEPVFETTNSGRVYLKAPVTYTAVNEFGGSYEVTGLYVMGTGSIYAIDSDGHLHNLWSHSGATQEFLQWGIGAVDILQQDNSAHGMAHIADSDKANQVKEHFAELLSQAPTTSQQSTQAPVNDEYSEGKVNPKTGKPLKNWQDPKYHGRVKQKKKTMDPKSPAFKKFFKLNAPEALPYVTDENGNPRIFYRGYGDFGKYLYVEHKSPGGIKPDGSEYYKNFYMDKFSTAKTYAGTDQIVDLRYIDNWETAKTAMRDIGLDLIEAKNPNTGAWGYQVVEKGTHAPAETKWSNWFAENQLAKFRATYGGGPKHQGIHAGFMALQHPMIIKGNGQNWLHIQATVTAPDGTTITTGMSTDEWAHWASKHGADSVILEDITDDKNGGGAIGIEIITLTPGAFKSIFNKGTWDASNDSILAHKENEKSQQLLDVQEKVELGKPIGDMTTEEKTDLAEEIRRVPEFKEAAEAATNKPSTLSWDVTDAISNYDVSEQSIENIRKAGVPEETIDLIKSGASYNEVIESLFTPNAVKEQHRVRDEMAYKRGSVVFDKGGNPQYTGEVRQDKRLDLVIGMPGSGKSTLVNPLSAQYKSRIADPDDAKKLHKDYHGGDNASPLHNESRFITQQARDLMIANGDNVVMPLVGHSYDDIKSQIQAFKDAGYSIHLHRVDLPWNKTISRGLDRTYKSGRMIRLDYLLGLDSTQLSPQKIADTFNRLVEEGLVDGYATWNNDVAEGQLPIATGYSDSGETALPAVSGTRGTPEAVQPRSGSGGKSGLQVQALKVPQKPQTPTQKHAQDVKKKLESPQRITQNLIKKLGFGNYTGSNNFGNLPRNILAFWEDHAKYVAAKARELGNYVTMMHEIGHGIASKLNLRGTQQMVDNLIKLQPEFASSYTPAQLFDEAFAEFMWRYMEDEQRARSFAGDAFYDNFERQLARDANMASAVAEAREQLQSWIGASVDDQIASTIVYDKSGERGTLLERIKGFFRDATYLMADKSSAAEEINQFLRELTGERDIDISHNVRAMSLLSNHSQKQATRLLTDFMIDANGTIIGDGFGKRLEKIGFKGTEENIKELEKYALALHSMQRDAEGKPVFDGHITPAARQAYIDRIQATRQDIVDAEKVWQEFRHEFLQNWMVDTGYWTQDFLDQLEHTYPHYVPTFRVGGNVEAMRGVGHGKQYTLHAATGSTQDIYSPLYSFIGMVDQITSMVNQNRVAQTFDRLYNEYEGLGDFARRLPGPANTNLTAIEQQQLQDLLQDEIDEDLMERVLDIVGRNPQIRRQEGNNILQVHRQDGTVVAYQFSNPELYKLMVGVEDRSNIRALNLLGRATRMMSMLTTGSNPLFAARNAVRDFQNGVNYGTWAKSYLDAIPKWAKAFWQVARQSDAYNDYQALGGGGWTRIDQNSTESMREMRDEIFGPKEWSWSATRDRYLNPKDFNVGRTAKWAGKKVWNLVTMNWLNETIEQATRFAEYRYGKHDLDTVEGRQEAFLAAQDSTVDFSRSGNSELATVMKRLIPFFNASMQGVYRTGRQFSEAERGRVGARFTKTVVNTALTSALAVGLTLLFSDDDDKEEFANMLSDGIKANHMILPNPLADKEGKNGQPPFLRIPLAQDPLSYMVHAAVTNALWNGTMDETAIGLAATVDVILDNLNPLGSGTIAQPFIDVSHNRTWFGGSIVRSSMEDWTDKASQYNEDTPGLFRFLGRLTDTSPEVLEYLATQYTGFLGATMIPALTYNSDGTIGGFDAVMQSVIKKWTADPLTSSDVTKYFYDMKKHFETIKDEAKKDRPQGLLSSTLTQDQVNAAYQEAEAMLGNKGIIGATSNLISKAYKEIDKINSNPDLTDAQKYELASKERRKMLEAVQAANEQLQGFQNRYMKGESLIDHWFGKIHEGKFAHIPTSEEKMPQVFQQDMDSSEPNYMTYAKEAYDTIRDKNGNQIDTILPHPQQTFTIKDTEYSIPGEEWDDYVNIYKTAYERHVIKNLAKWELLNDDQKKAIFSGSGSAHSKGMDAIRNEYKRRNSLK